MTAAVLFFLASGLAEAMIEGTVTDGLNSVPVESVLVQVKGTTVETRTDAAGHFTLQTATGIKTFAPGPTLGPEDRQGISGTVYGTDGRIVRRGPNTSPKLLMSGLPEGMYFYTTSQDGNRACRKLVITGGYCRTGRLYKARAKAGAVVTLVYSHPHYTTKEASAAEGDQNVTETLDMWYPDETTTGVESGTNLTDYTGTYEVRANGATISGLRITGRIKVYGNNVTVKNCEVNCGGNLYGIAAASAYAETGGAGLKVFNCRVYVDGDRCLGGVVGADEIAYCDISGVENCTYGGTNYIHDNYLHDHAHFGGEHTDGVQTWGAGGAGGFRAVHNTIIAIQTAGAYTLTNYAAGSSAIALMEGMHDLTLDANYLAGGTYTLYGPSQAGASPANVHVTNNRFSNQYFPKCGQYGTHTGFNAGAPGFQWTGNVWYETGTPVNP